MKDSALDQEKFNHLISQLISDMSLDENVDKDEKNDEDNNNNEKESKPKNQSQNTKQKEESHEEMSIESSILDHDNQTKESDNTEEAVEIEDSSRPDLKKSGSVNFGDIKHRITEEFDEIIKVRILKVTRNSKIKEKFRSAVA